jgi:hypothetical protein
MLWVPLFGHFASMLGCQSVERENYIYHLENGNSVSLTPGGVEEIKLVTKDSANKVHVLRATAFLRAAYSRRVPVVPMLTLGEHTCYRFYPSIESVQNFFMKICGWPFPVLALGRWGSILPRRESSIEIVRGDAMNPQLHESVENFIEAYYLELKRIADTENVELVLVQRKK